MVERQLELCKFEIKYSDKKIDRKIQTSQIALKNKKDIQNKKSNNGLKVKNDNGPISVFICYCSTSR